jgi:hypothetical protein
MEANPQVHVPVPPDNADSDAVASECGSSAGESVLNHVRRRPRQRRESGLLGGMVGSDVEGDQDSGSHSHADSSSGGGSSSGGSSNVRGEASESSASAVADEDVVGLGMPALELPVRFDGHTYESHRSFTHPALKVKCPCAAHGASCMKVRLRGVAQTSKYGDWEPVAFLVAWLRCAGEYPDMPSHRGRREVSDDELDQAFQDLRNTVSGDRLPGVEQTTNKLYNK